MTTIDNPGESKWEQFCRAAKYADFFVIPNCTLAELDASDGRRNDYPVWVRRSVRKVIRAVFPRVHRVVQGQAPSRGYELGLAAGMVESGERMLADLAEELGPIPEDALTPEKEKFARRQMFGKDADQFTYEEGSVVPVEFTNDVVEAEKQFNLMQKADFHQAIADVARMMAVFNETTFPIKVYLFIAVYWRAIEVFPTFESFYDLMVKVYGQASVGHDPKHLAQILGRVGKRFRRPGRPPKKIPSTALDR